MISSPECFDPIAHHAKKYKDQPVTLLSLEEYARQLGKIEASIKEVILKAHEESQRESNTIYPIDGVIICGSWALGKVHDRSDLDLLYLTRNYCPAYSNPDFPKKLQRNGLDMEIHELGYVLLLDPRDTMRSAVNRTFLTEDSRIVTPFPEIEANSRELIMKWRTRPKWN